MSRVKTYRVALILALLGALLGLTAPTYNGAWLLGFILLVSAVAVLGLTQQE